MTFVCHRVAGEGRTLAGARSSDVFCAASGRIFGSCHLCRTGPLLECMHPSIERKHTYIVHKHTQALVVAFI